MEDVVESFGRGGELDQRGGVDTFIDKLAQVRSGFVRFVHYDQRAVKVHQVSGSFCVPQRQSFLIQESYPAQGPLVRKRAQTHA